MTVRVCLPWPNPCLRTPAAEVEEITDEIKSIWADMIDTMEAMPGVGLAAPQIGIGLRLAVVDASSERGRAVRLANPVILQASSELRSHTEASPNLPGVSAKLKRPRQITVRYLAADGRITRRDFEELEATSVQHQIDHLDGMMYFDRLSKLKRDMLVRKAKKLNG